MTFSVSQVIAFQLDVSYFGEWKGVLTDCYDLAGEEQLQLLCQMCMVAIPQNIPRDGGFH